MEIIISCTHNVACAIIKLGNGSFTFFWHDSWLNCGILSTVFPRLFNYLHDLLLQLTMHGYCLNLKPLGIDLFVGILMSYLIGFSFLSTIFSFIYIPKMILGQAPWSIKYIYNQATYGCFGELLWWVALIILPTFFIRWFGQSLIPRRSQLFFGSLILELTQE